MFGIKVSVAHKPNAKNASKMGRKAPSSAPELAPQQPLFMNRLRQNCQENSTHILRMRAPNGIHDILIVSRPVRRECPALE